ncbi:MAG: hypothetical protein IJS65_00115 [Clostridia bacterium]|nr:hypothetical protein [Clostridia bacterium]
MTAFSLLPEGTQRLFAALCFFAASVQLFLCVYGRFVLFSRARRILDGILFASLTALCACLQACAAGAFYVGFYGSFTPFLCAAVFLRALILIRRGRKKRFDTLSPDCVKETLDGLEDGVAFSDGSGRIILMNKASGELIASLSGRYPQTLSEINEALKLAEKADGSSSLYRFPDGRVRRADLIPLSGTYLSGFTQITLQDVNDVFETNLKLTRENAELKAAVEKASHMLSVVSERVREQEALEMKTRVHNDIGKSLIALSDLMNGGKGSTDEEMRVLKRAVSLITRSAPESPRTLKSAVREAKELNVGLEISGAAPLSPETEEILTAAASECVTNCVRHAKGTRVYLELSETKDGIRALFTNDGAPPNGKIKEGGGLSSLRRRVQDAGGEMLISREPRFALSVKLPKRRNGV